MKFRVRARYISVRTLEVEVKDGGDPLRPDSWEEIESEEETDFFLEDTTSAEPIE